MSHKASDRSLACSHVSVAVLHFSASFWYREAILLASANVMLIWWLCSLLTVSLSFISSDKRSTNCFPISSLRSGSSPPQSVSNQKHNKWWNQASVGWGKTKNVNKLAHQISINQQRWYSKFLLFSLDLKWDFERFNTMFTIHYTFSMLTM